MVKDKITLKKDVTLELHSAGLLCRESMKFKSSVFFQYDGDEYDAKRIHSFIGLGIEAGESITLSCSGEDEGKAFDRIKALFKNEL